jgi:hypothetical protein
VQKKWRLDEATINHSNSPFVLVLHWFPLLAAKEEGACILGPRHIIVIKTSSALSPVA